MAASFVDGRVDAFAMVADGVLFIDELAGFEAYQIDGAGQATLTRGFDRYVIHA